MDGKSTSLSVNRAFRVMGTLFLVGGLYLGGILYFTALEVFEITGNVVSVKIEKEGDRINTFARVEYKYDGQIFGGNIVSWGEPVNWKKGEMLPLYLVEGEENIPLNYFPSEAARGKKDALMVGIGLSAAGIIFGLMGYFSDRSERKQTEDELIKIRELKKMTPPRRRWSEGETILERTNRGNYLLGAILSILGVILISAITPSLWDEGTPGDRLLRGFPVILGLSLIYLGSWEFYSEKITLTDRDVHIRRRAFWNRFDRKLSLDSFEGVEVHPLRQMNISTQLYVKFHEIVLIHEDADYNELSIALFPVNKKSDQDIDKLCGQLNLPRIIKKEGELNLVYPL